MAVPNIFGTATSAIPLSQLDTNFATAITLGNTAVYLGNTTTSFGNVTLTNVTISSGNLTVTSPAIFPAGTAALPAITTTGDTNTGIFFPAADQVAISTGGVEAMRIDSSGNLLVGTVVLGGAERLNVTKSVAGTEIVRFIPTHATDPYGLGIVYTNANPNGAVNEFIGCFSSGSTKRMTVQSNGGIANYAANNVILSDRREKTNFAPATSYLDKICAIPVQTFNYIDQNFEEDDGLTLGVVAQDVQAVAPEMVMESNWGTNEEPKMRLSIYQTDLQYALMKCIQEQQALITALTARITALESK